MAEKRPVETNEPQTSTGSMDGDARRTFLKGAAVATGVAATVGMAAQAKAQDLHLDGVPAVTPIDRPAVMKMSFDPRDKVKLVQIQRLLEDALGTTGCPTCGLVGLDIRIGLEEIVSTKTDLATVVIEGGRTF